MRKCDYCGKANAQDLACCSGCGTPLPPAAEAEEDDLTGTGSGPVMVQLDARRATKILGIVFGAAFVGGFLAAAAAAIVFTAQGNTLRGEEQIRHFFRVANDPIGAAMTAAAGVALLSASRSLPREALSGGGPMAAAWRVGPATRIAQGLAVGALTGVAIALLFEQHGKHGLFGPVKIVAALALAPPMEELLFRGLLYAGYRRSLGPVWATVLTTSMFSLLHIGQLIRTPLAVLGIGGMALAALWFRLRSGAIGPSVAVHAGYNAGIVAVLLCYDVA
jgi:membrane protease YdiL (CAAX protease family)